MIVRMAKLIELEEERKKGISTLDDQQMQVKRSFDKKATTRVFKEGDLVIKWDADREKVGGHSNFDSLWSGPYVISSCKETNGFQLSKPNGEVLPILVNEIHLKLFF